MTIAGLLKKHGHTVPRSIAQDGKLLFGSSVSASIAIPVAPHRFHGGELPEDQDHATAVEWWLDGATIERDRAEMAKWFPNFVEVPRDDGGPSSWGGSIDTGRGKFMVGIVHRPDRELPRVILLDDRRLGRLRGRTWVKPPHIYLDGSLCVASKDDWDSTRDSVATVVAWTAHWCACYVDWFVTTNWPTEGYFQDVAA